MCNMQRKMKTKQYKQCKQKLVDVGEIGKIIEYVSREN